MILRLFNSGDFVHGQGACLLGLRGFRVCVAPGLAGFRASRAYRGYKCFRV